MAPPPPCRDSFIRKHGVNYEKIEQESLEVVSCSKSNGELDASMTSSSGPRIGGVEVNLEMGINRVKKTCRLIRLTSASLLMSTH
jgi:hypothetical protein